MTQFRKNNQYLCYINVGSNQSRRIFNYILMALYLDHLHILYSKLTWLWIGVKDCGYKDKHIYKSIDKTSEVRYRTNWTRKII